MALPMMESHVHDSLETDNLIQNTSRKIETVTGDKAYDNKYAYDAIARVKSWPQTPPRSEKTQYETDASQLQYQKHLESWAKTMKKRS